MTMTPTEANFIREVEQHRKRIAADVLGKIVGRVVTPAEMIGWLGATHYLAGVVYELAQMYIPADAMPTAAKMWTDVGTSDGAKWRANTETGGPANELGRGVPTGNWHEMIATFDAACAQVGVDRNEVWQVASNAGPELTGAALDAERGILETLCAAAYMLGNAQTLLGAFDADAVRRFVDEDMARVFVEAGRKACVPPAITDPAAHKVVHIGTSRTRRKPKRRT